MTATTAKKSNHGRPTSRERSAAVDDRRLLSGQSHEIVRASWGGILYRAKCQECGDVCLFDGTRFICDDCWEPLKKKPPASRVRQFSAEESVSDETGHV